MYVENMNTIHICIEFSNKIGSQSGCGGEMKFEIKIEIEEEMELEVETDRVVCHVSNICTYTLKLDYSNEYVI